MPKIEKPKLIKLLKDLLEEQQQVEMEITEALYIAKQNGIATEELCEIFERSIPWILKKAEIGKYVHAMRPKKERAVSRHKHFNPTHKESKEPIQDPGPPPVPVAPKVEPKPEREYANVPPTKDLPKDFDYGGVGGVPGATGSKSAPEPEKIPEWANTPEPEEPLVTEPEPEVAEPEPVFREEPTQEVTEQPTLPEEFPPDPPPTEESFGSEPAPEIQEDTEPVSVEEAEENTVTETVEVEAPTEHVYLPDAPTFDDFDDE